LLKPVHHAQRHFSIPKALPQISFVAPRQPEPATPATPSLSEEAAENENEDFVHDAAEVAADETESECALSNPYYATLLASKLDACPPQPFNEATNIVWGAVYDTVQRGHRTDLMSRWEQIQRGLIRCPADADTEHSQTERAHSERRRHTNGDKYRERGNGSAMSRRNGFVDTICNVNDLLQTHQSLDDVVRHSKAQRSHTLAKATGALGLSVNGMLGEARATQAKKKAEMERTMERERENAMEMRNDLKWRVRKMKLHRKKKRREGLRQKRTNMRKQSNND